MLGGRLELGLVPGINPDYFRPFGLDYAERKSPTLEFVGYLRAAFGEKQPFWFHGEAFHTGSAELGRYEERSVYQDIDLLGKKSLLPRASTDNLGV